jgi:molecular chaperone DnaK
MADIIGIDLGTTKSVVTIWRDGAPQVIRDAEGRGIMPSVVALDPDTNQLVAGYRAQEIATQHPRLAVSSIKRFMGRRFREEVVQDDLSRDGQTRILYDVEESRRKQGGIEVVLGDKHLTPQQISALILGRLKALAEAELKREIAEAVITVPAYFHDSQRQATRDAGRIAGLEVRRVLNEPTSACLAYGYSRLDEPRRRVAVYDLGGGTFDISILEMGDGRPFSVWAINGDTHLGGDDLDWLIIEWALGQVGGDIQSKIRDDIVALARLRAAARRAKIELSEAAEARLRVEGPLSPESGVTDLDLPLTRATLNTIAKPWIDRTLEPCRKALADAGLGPSDIDEVLLVGGQTRMPAIREAVGAFFGRAPNTTLHPEEVVGMGAAVQGAVLAGQAHGIKLADAIPLSLGVKTGAKMDRLIARNTPLPYRMPEPKIYSTVVPNQESVEIMIYQGERPLAEDNTKLGAFRLSGILPAPAGEPEIAVTFHVDQDGILHVAGEDLRTGAKQQLTITDSMRLTDEEIAAMVRDAEANAEADAARLHQITLQEQVQDLTNRLKALPAARRAQLPADLAAAIQAALDEPAPDDLAARLAQLQELLRRAGEAV